MAHIEKFKIKDVQLVLQHNDKKYRMAGHVKSNEDIDTELSKNNYTFVSGNAFKNFKNRINEIYVYGANGKNKDNINYLVSFCVHLPTNWDSLKKQGITEKQYFEAVYNMTADKYGKKNIVCADVHTDECKHQEPKGINHIHIGFVPVVGIDKPRKDGKTEKLCFEKVITRNTYQKYHSWLEQGLTKQLGAPVKMYKPEADTKSQEHIKSMQEYKAKKQAEQKAKEYQKELIDKLEASAIKEKKRLDQEAEEYAKKKKAKVDAQVKAEQEKQNQLKIQNNFLIRWNNWLSRKALLVIEKQKEEEENLFTMRNLIKMVTPFYMAIKNYFELASTKNIMMTIEETQNQKEFAKVEQLFKDNER